MKSQATILEGAALAFGISILGVSGYFILTSLFNGTSAIRALIAILCLLYVVYLLARSNSRIGKITVACLWFIIAVLDWFFVPTLVLYIVVHLGMIWLIRSLYFHYSIFSSIIDLCITLLGLGAYMWSWSATQSLFLSIWCFFLIQALYTTIPPKIFQPSKNLKSVIHEDQFEIAHRTAEMALQKLTSSN